MLVLAQVLFSAASPPFQPGHFNIRVFAVDGSSYPSFLRWRAVRGDHGERVSRVRLVVDRVGASFGYGE